MSKSHPAAKAKPPRKPADSPGRVQRLKTRNWAERDNPDRNTGKKQS
jgi:hypothetical protein